MATGQCQAKSEVLPYSRIETFDEMHDLCKKLHTRGYAGSFNAAGDASRLDMAAPDVVAVNLALGDVVIYRTGPLVIVDCKKWDEFNAKFDILP